MKLLIYTSMFGPKDDIEVPLWIPPGAEFLCYTDQPKDTIPEPWKYIEALSTSIDPVRSAKLYKVLPHKYLPEHDVSIWVDSNIHITLGYDELLEDISSKGMIVLVHPYRDCIYEETKAVIDYKMDSETIIRKQIDRYRSEGFPERYGLAECNLLIRRPVDNINILMETWWNEICNGSRRDQLSFMYCVWKLGMLDKITIIKEHTSRDGYYHNVNRHKHVEQFHIPE